MAKQVAHLLDERLSPDGLNLTQANRAAGWQEVFHFHVHVIPRWSGDGLTPFSKPSRPSGPQLAATLAPLVGGQAGSAASSSHGMGLGRTS